MKKGRYKFSDKILAPPPSTPRATGQSPADTTAADPLEEPPAILVGLYGFLVALQGSYKQTCYCHNQPHNKSKKEGKFGHESCMIKILVEIMKYSLTHNVDLCH